MAAGGSRSRPDEPLGLEHSGNRPPSDDALDLVLGRDELDMLEVFHRSFNLPGLRLGLLRPVCTDDYFPEEEEAAVVDPAIAAEAAAFAARAANEPSAADELAKLLQKSTTLHAAVDEVLEEEIDTAPEPEPMVTLPRVGTHTHSRSILRRPSSGVRGGSSSRPTSSGVRPPR